MNNDIIPISCVIFDMDGTLTKTNDLIFESFNHVAEKYTGKTMTPREIITLFGPPEEGGLETLVGSAAVHDAMDDLCIYYKNNHNRLASLHSGIQGTLKFLTGKGVKLAIFTGKGRRTAEITLEELGIEKYFDLVISGSDVVHHKPHHEGIVKILNSFSLQPDNVLMIGDAISDIQASRSAGVRVAAVVWDSYDRERVLQANADYVFHNVGEMFEWFKANIN